LVQQKVKKCSQQWREWVNSATTKEKPDKSITEIWSELGETGKECFPPFLPKTTMVVTKDKRAKKTSKCSKTQS
jgi:hypothetical protein